MTVKFDIKVINTLKEKKLKPNQDTQSTILNQKTSFYLSQWQKTGKTLIVSAN